MRSNSPYPVLNNHYPVRGKSVTSRPTSRASLIHPSPNGIDEEESTPLLGLESTVIAVYPRRWYLLLLFSLVALFQTLIWATWGPISQSAEAALSWDDSNITMCVWMGNVPFALLCIPLSWLMDHKGLRISVLLTCLFMTVGAGLRCLIHFVPTSYFTWCIYAGQFFNGMAGPVAQGGGALFSNLWFPTNQRATSTAISTFIGYLGSALAFVVGPQIVPSPADEPNPNTTLPDGGNLSVAEKYLRQVSYDDNSTVTTDYTVQMNGIKSYLYYQAGGSCLVFLLVLAYFPDKPPQPPSISAAMEREEFKAGLKMLVRNKQFWLISIAFCMSLGVFEVWDVVLDVILSYIDISQEEAGWLGFYCVMAGCIAGLAICRLADIFFRQIRLFLILAYVVSAIFVLWFILIYINILPFDLVSIYAAIILSGVFLDGVSPLVYELVCEAAYPAGEGVSSCFLQMLFVLAGIAFTSVQEIPNIGTTWMNWCLFGAICAAIPLLCCVGDVSGRTELDAVEDQVIVVQPPINPSTQHDHAIKDTAILTDSATHTHPSKAQRSYQSQEAHAQRRNQQTEQGEGGMTGDGSFHKRTFRRDSFDELCHQLYGSTSQSVPLSGRRSADTYRKRNEEFMLTSGRRSVDITLLSV
ncbi:solute carrier family 49 member 4-like [Littorina saxatilis]|uniref:Uncharacterized protein n=1 Tax=Littorina saxatilis TaxID=31220 RepID=A0AAN9G2H5_9CAEN